MILLLIHYLQNQVYAIFWMMYYIIFLLTKNFSTSPNITLTHLTQHHLTLPHHLASFCPSHCLLPLLSPRCVALSPHPRPPHTAELPCPATPPRTTPLCCPAPPLCTALPCCPSPHCCASLPNCTTTSLPASLRRPNSPRLAAPLRCAAPPCLASLRRANLPPSTATPR